MSGFNEADHPRGQGARFVKKPVVPVASEVEARLWSLAQVTATSPRLVDDEAEFDNLRDVAAAQFRMPAGAVEKDYWATQALRSVTQPLEPVTNIVFKGGTSLSKAFGLIDRFSEDIDILVRIDPNTSKRGGERAFKALAERAAQELDVVRENKGGGPNHLNARLYYPVRTPATFLSDGVLLEMGTAGGEYPNEQCQVTSVMGLVAEARDESAITEFSDLAPFHVTCLAPHRTLAEKLAYLHHRASTQDTDGLYSGARHLYDVAMLLEDEDIHTRLAAEPILSFLDDIDRHTQLAGRTYTARGENGFAASPAFHDATALEHLRRGYDDISQYIWGRHPDFDNAVGTVLAHAELL